MSNMGRRRCPSASQLSARETGSTAARYGQHYATDIAVDAGGQAVGMVWHRWAKGIRLLSVSK
jgi:hypothetical protein